MPQAERLNTEKLARTLSALFVGGAVVELRTFDSRGTYSGYFDNHDELAKIAARHNELGRDVYITLNEVKPDLLARRSNRIDRTGKKDALTSDNDISRRRFMFVDVDPTRPAGISSTDEEKQKAKAVAIAVRDYFKKRGWPDPIICDSGNGYHLIVPIDLPNDPASLALVAGVLAALDFMFSDDGAEVDTGTKNAARITKLYGVTARKGDHTPGRPHRTSRILKAPEVLTPASREQLEEVAAIKPEEPRRPFRVYSGGTDHKEPFDLYDWIPRYNVPVKREGPWKDGGRRWILQECPWFGHTDNSAYIVQQPTGEIAAGCHHNSCQGRNWRDLREYYQPGAYDRKEQSTPKESASNGIPDSAPQGLIDLPEPLAFPTDALPNSVRRFVEEAAASVGCPVDFVAVPALVALSAAIGDTRRVVIKKSWTEGAALYAGILGEAATKKTPAMNLALRPVRDRQMELKAEYERALVRYEAELRDHKKASKEGPTELAPPEQPTLGRTYVDDTTVERAADILNENPRGLALTRDELSSWLASMNQYKAGGKGSDRQFWLSVHTNQPIAVDRKTSDRPVIVAHPFVSIIGGIQPAVLPDFGKDRGDGLMERFIFGYPEHQSSRWTEDEVEDETTERYAATVNALYRLEHADAGDGPFPSRVPMTAPAKALFVAEYNALHEEIDEPGFPARLRPAFGKLEAYLARFSLILAMTRLHDSNDSNDSKFSNEVVTESDMRGAIKLLGYFKNHTRRVYVGLYGDSPSDRLEGDLKDFLESKNGGWEGIASELHEALVSQYKPERPEDLAKVVRAICRRPSRLNLEALQRTGSRRPFRLTLENAVIADIAVTPSSEEEPPPMYEERF
jgi:hypothetical protein